MARKNKRKNKGKLPQNNNKGFPAPKQDKAVGGVEIQQKTDSEKIEAIGSELDFLVDKRNKSSSFFSRFIGWLREKQVLSKIFIICFAMLVFSYAYFNVEASSRNVLSYIGLMLTMLVAYIEILIVRDHLWVIEGSIPESHRWREIFFNPSSIRKQKFRKMIVLIFALIVFAMVYKYKVIPGARNALSFMGLVLMITVVYYEILAIRDEILLLSKAMQRLLAKKEIDI